MSYTTGTANDMTAVRQALIDACVAEGWSWNGSTNVLSQGSIFVRLALANGYLRLWGRVSAEAGETPVPHQVGPFTWSSSLPVPVLSWPVQYRIFVFHNEVYCVLQYAVDTFQWLAFGRSTVRGLPGCGTWIQGCATGAESSYWDGTNMSAGFGKSGGGGFCPAPFWSTGGDSDHLSCVHSDLDDQGWKLGQPSSANVTGIAALAPLISMLPSRWNSEAVLLPIRSYKTRASQKISLVVDLEHARHTRIDNYEPAQILTLGPDRWMVFPFLRKNLKDRDTGRPNHSGTFGWAIRYEGA